MFANMNKFKYFMMIKLPKMIIKDDKKFHSIIFYLIHREKIDWQNPANFSQKINYRKIYQNSPLFSKCSDKFLVREYVKNHSKKCNLIPLIGIYDKFDEINFSQIKDNVIIKTNHASGTCFVLKDDSNLYKIKKKIEMALSMDYGEFTRERHYSRIKPKIIVEKLLTNEDGTLPNDIKIHCFNGEPKFIQIANSSHTTNDIFDLKWNLIDVVYRNKQSKKEIQKPKNLDEILEISKELSAEFDYVRVDLYDVRGKIYFGELTFTPNGGFAKVLPRSYDYEWGKYWDMKI